MIKENKSIKTENTDLKSHIALLNDAIYCNKKYIEDLEICIKDIKSQSNAKSKIIEDIEQTKLTQNNKIKKLEEEKHIMQNSTLYKIGRFFSCIPRKNQQDKKL